MASSPRQRIHRFGQRALKSFRKKGCLGKDRENDVLKSISESSSAHLSCVQSETEAETSSSNHDDSVPAINASDINIDTALEDNSSINRRNAMKRFDSWLFLSGETVASASMSLDTPSRSKHAVPAIPAATPRNSLERSFQPSCGQNLPTNRRGSLLREDSWLNMTTESPLTARKRAEQTTPTPSA
eukprot:Nitzschia sp. Nitz4//scaffold186_size43309//12950//13507//NITZ4_007317-RA/size43309-processed-gene-0.38-mRNA-1//-1//CDS//3329539758//1704//frame0